MSQPVFYSIRNFASSTPATPGQMTTEGPGLPRITAAPAVAHVAPLPAVLSFDADVQGFADDPPSADVVAFQAEMKRRMVVKNFMRVVLMPLVLALPPHKVDSMPRYWGEGKLLLRKAGIYSSGAAAR